jgi:hypothetical protein
MRPGTYKARASKADVGITQNGTRYVRVTFDVAGDPFDGNSDEQIDWMGWLTPKAAKRTCESLAACGWTAQSFGDWAGLGDTEVEIEVAEEEYRGQTQLRVQWVNAPRRAPVGLAGELDAMFAADLMAARK